MRIDNSIQNSYQRLSSGKSINSAADNAAGLAISQQLQSQINGYDTANNNVQSFSDLADTAGGALGSIQDNLQRMRELAVQASNGTLSDGDKQIIQTEIEGIKSSIGDAVQNTQFNTQKLLDGTFVNKEIASNPKGTGSMMTIQDTGLQTLGIANFNVTGNFDISDIDNAISKVSDAQSNIGATSNSLEYDAESNETSEENLTSADSQISDTDMASEIQNMKTQQLLQQFSIFAQQQKTKQNSSMLNLLG